MSALKRGMVIDIDLDPTKGSETGKIRPCVVVTNDVYNERVPVVQVVPVTSWNEKKARIITNVEINPTSQNGLTKKSVADCLQTRPVDYGKRFEITETSGLINRFILKNGQRIFELQIIIQSLKDKEPETRPAADPA